MVQFTTIILIVLNIAVLAASILLAMNVDKVMKMLGISPGTAADKETDSVEGFGNAFTYRDYKLSPMYSQFRTNVQATGTF